jgi:hypothetical protein
LRLLDIDKTKEYYSSLSDGELVHRVTINSKDRIPEVLLIIRDELEARNLSPRYLDAAIAQNKQFTSQEFSVYTNLIRGLNCPVCQNRSEKLNATVLHTIFSIIVYTSTSKELLIACPTCLDSKNSNSTSITLVAGWWSLPGFFQTPLYLWRNIKMRNEHHSESANTTLKKFIEENIGRIELNKDDDAFLTELIAERGKLKN